MKYRYELMFAPSRKGSWNEDLATRNKEKDVPRLEWHSETLLWSLSLQNYKVYAFKSVC